MWGKYSRIAHSDKIKPSYEEYFLMMVENRPVPLKHLENTH